MLCYSSEYSISCFKSQHYALRTLHPGRSYAALDVGAIRCAMDSRDGLFPA